MKRWTKLLIAATIAILLICFSLFFLLREAPSNNHTTGNANNNSTATTPNGQQTSETDPFEYVIQAYARLVQDPQWKQELTEMDEEQRRAVFAQGFEMLPENAFTSWATYRNHDPHMNLIPRLAFYDIDGDGTMALLLGFSVAIADIYIIQDGVAVQQKSFFSSPRYGGDGGARLFSNGVISGYYGDERLYHFEDGILRELNREVSGGWEIKQLDWQPITAFRHQFREDDPFNYVLHAYARLVQEPQWGEELYHMTEEQRRDVFAQGFEMLPRNAFLSLNAYRLEDERNLAYAFHDTDGNGTIALLLASDSWGITDIFVIQNGIAAQLVSIDAGEASVAFFLSSGVFYHVVLTQDLRRETRFYRFEDGALVRFATLIAGVGGENYYHILADGTEVSITRDQFNEISEEYLGNGEFKNLDWRPIAEFGR